MKKATIIFIFIISFFVSTNVYANDKTPHELNEEIIETLRQLADARGVTMAYLLRLAIFYGLKESV